MTVSHQVSMPPTGWLRQACFLIGIPVQFAAYHNNHLLCAESPGMCSSRPHHMTILDGEMVVDDNMVADQQNRRFLVYDLVVLNGVSKMYEPFKVQP